MSNSKKGEDPRVTAAKDQEQTEKAQAKAASAAGAAAKSHEAANTAEKNAAKGAGGSAKDADAGKAKALPPGVANAAAKAGLRMQDGEPIKNVRGLAKAQWDAGRYYEQ